MRTNIISIGNSRGVRIPKALLSNTGMTNEVEMEARGKEIVIRAANPRSGWNEAFGSATAEVGLLWNDTPTEWDEREWQW